jgi:hypothetical protein
LINLVTYFELRYKEKKCGIRKSENQKIACFQDLQVTTHIANRDTYSAIFLNCMQTCANENHPSINVFVSIYAISDKISANAAKMYSSGQIADLVTDFPHYVV